MDLLLSIGMLLGMLLCGLLIFILFVFIIFMIIAIINAPDLPGHALKFVDILAKLVMAFAAMLALVHWW